MIARQTLFERTPYEVLIRWRKAGLPDVLLLLIVKRFIGGYDVVVTSFSFFRYCYLGLVVAAVYAGILLGLMNFFSL